MGRFTESDPVGLLGGPNTYGYTGGRPLQRSDPFGLRAMPSGDLDRDLGWQPSPNDPFRGEADGVCVLACLTVKLALGDFVTRDYQKAEPLLRDRQLGFGSRGTRLTIGRIGRGIGAIGKAFRLTPPGVLIGLGWAIDFCDAFCQHGVGQYSCRANWVDRANMSFRGFGD